MSGKSDYRFYMRVLYARSSPAKLRKLGIPSLAAADCITARMGNGAAKSDAFYACKKNRQGFAGYSKKNRKSRRTRRAGKRRG